MFIRLIIIFFLFPYVVFAAPEIGIGSMYDVLAPDEQSITKRIYNTGTSTAFVRIDLLEMNPDKNGNGESTQKEITDNNKLKKNRLIVTPLRMIIPPSGFQSARILWPGDRNKEKYFRVRFTPVMPDANDGFGLDNEAVDKYKKDALHAGVNILAGYGTIVIVQPNTPVFNTIIDDAHSDFTKIKNNGNATILLKNIRHCRAENTDCDTSSREFIYPGSNTSIPKKSGFITQLTIEEGGITKKNFISKH